MPASRLITLLGTTLRQQRELNDLTQQALAERVGVSQPAIARYERGDRAPSVPMLERLLAALQVQLAVSVEPLDAHLDARIEQLRQTSVVERIEEIGLNRALDRLGRLPFVLTGATAALLQGVPLPVDDLEIAVAWRDVDQFADWLNSSYAHRWNERWQEFGYLRTDPREPGEHRWRTVAGVLRASMCDELPPTIEVRHDGRSYRVVPLALVEVAERDTADLLRRYRDRQATDGRSAG